MMKTLNEQNSLIIGGPFSRFQSKLGMLDASFLPTKKTAFIFVAIAWIPLALLSMLEGNAWGDTLRDRALYLDFGVYARFIIAIGMLVIMERYVEELLSQIIKQFSITELIVSDDSAKFKNSLQVADERTSSSFAESTLLLLAFIASIFGVYNYLSVGGATWIGSMQNEHIRLSMAGWWALCISFPLFWFLVLRWLWRFVVWTQLLWKITNMKLRLVASHPDSCGGIGFLALYPPIFSGLVFALSCVIASMVLGEIVYDGAALQSIIAPFAAWLTIVLIIFVGPLAVFIPILFRLKQQAYFEYSTFVHQHNCAFETKWMQSKFGGKESLAEPDISSVSDLGVIYDAVRTMRLIPIDLRSLLPLIIAAGLPWVGIAATKVPFINILKALSAALL